MYLIAMSKDVPRNPSVSDMDQVHHVPWQRLRVPHVHGDAHAGRVRPLPSESHSLAPFPILSVSFPSSMAGVVSLKSDHSPSALNPATVAAVDLSAPSRQPPTNEVHSPSSSCRRSPLIT